MSLRLSLSIKHLDWPLVKKNLHLHHSSVMSFTHTSYFQSHDELNQVAPQKLKSCRTSKDSQNVKNWLLGNTCSTVQSKTITCANRKSRWHHQTPSCWARRPHSKKTLVHRLHRLHSEEAKQIIWVFASNAT